MAKYYDMVTQHGLIATVPVEEFIELLEYKLEKLERLQKEDSSWNYPVHELRTEIQTIKGFVALMRS